MISYSDRVRGGFWGLLVGDALGVPYEFYKTRYLPTSSDIEMRPPSGFRKAHNVPAGTWSDDGAQALCLLDSLVARQSLDIQDFSQRLIAWYDNGLWAIDGQVFDVGNQTRDAIQELKRGKSPAQAGFVHPDGKGNGALMRVLPLALWHKGSDDELIEDAHVQSIVTHGHVTNQICCALYCLWARRLLEGADPQESYASAVATLRGYYSESSAYRRDLEFTIRPDESPKTDGTGYVVSTLHCARLVLQEHTYEKVVKAAISYGEDTDTNAAVAGGLAGIRFGVRGIPARWMETLRGRKLAETLLASLVREG